MKRSLLGEVKEYFARRSKPFLIIAGFILVLLLGLVDYITGAELNISIFYLLALSLMGWFVSRGGTFVISH